MLRVNATPEPRTSLHHRHTLLVCRSARWSITLVWSSLFAYSCSLAVHWLISARLAVHWALTQMVIQTVRQTWGDLWRQDWTLPALPNPHSARSDLQAPTTVCGVDCHKLSPQVNPLGGGATSSSVSVDSLLASGARVVCAGALICGLKSGTSSAGGFNCAT